MKIKDITLFNLKETKDPDAEKIIVAYNKRIAVLERAQNTVDQETRQFKYIENDILTLVEKIKEIAYQTNVSIDDYVDNVLESMTTLSNNIYGLREAFGDEIYNVESEIEKLQYED